MSRAGPVKDRNVLPLVETEPTVLGRPPCSSQFTVLAPTCYSTALQSQGHTCTYLFTYLLHGAESFLRS